VSEWRRRWGAAALAVLPLVVALLLAGCGTKEEGAAEGGAAEESKESAAEDAARDSGFVSLEPEARKAAGITLTTAGPGVVDVQLEFPGEIRFDPARVLEVKPRFAGVVRDLRKQLGDAVHRGEVVAQVESNESLTRYPVTSSLAGRVIARDGAVGQAVSTDASLYTIADLSAVWIEFAIYPNQLARVKRGQPAVVTPQSDSLPQAGMVSYLGPSPERGAGVSIGRVALRNPRGRWEPGLFAEVRVTVDRFTAPVAVPDEAVVRTDEGSVVFVVVGERYRQTPVEVGRGDGRMTEIRGGLAAGTEIVVHGAYTLRSELEKSKYEE
jgi:cobalt-zinc-cadmium efflux system membrane fusion protein